MTETQGWFVVVELGIIAVSYLATFFNRRP
jgi:hypothetical protein